MKVKKRTLKRILFLIMLLVTLINCVSIIGISPVMAAPSSAAAGQGGTPTTETTPPSSAAAGQAPANEFNLTGNEYNTDMVDGITGLMSRISWINIISS